MRALKIRAWWPAIGGHQLRAIIKADPLTTTQEVARELSADHSVVGITSDKHAHQMDEMHWKLQPALLNRKGQILHGNTQPHVVQPELQKLNELGYEVLPHPFYSPDLLPTDYPFFKHFYNFLQGKCFHNPQEAEKAFQEHFCQILKHEYFCYRNKTKHFLLAKNLLIVKLPMLTNKDVFEPSYNDLKGTARNYSYFLPT